MQSVLLLELGNGDACTLRRHTLAMCAREGRKVFLFSGQMYLENVINPSKQMNFRIYISLHIQQRPKVLLEFALVRLDSHRQKLTTTTKAFMSRPVP